ncbi:MAG: AAA family ATPase, partial [Phaeodactylibacter sp.]|nr:AAA family ATPase [Phaeodactylibacter sp.]
MAFELDIPCYAFTLRFQSGGQLIFPMLDPTAWHYQYPLESLAERYRTALQEKVLNQGNYLELLEEYQQGPFLRATLKVPFEEDPRGNRYPAFELEFDYFYQDEPDKCWGIVPVLGVESFSFDLPSLQDQLVRAVRLDFTRNRRLHQLKGLVEALWLEVNDLRQVPIKVKTFSPQELENSDVTDQVQLLDKAAVRMQVQKSVAYFREKELQQLINALKNPFNRNLLVVGPSGVGKTALIQELARQSPAAGIQNPFWETTASRLIKELTLDTGWQDNLVFLCREVKEKGVILFVNNLMELFEIGQYEGNAVSMAEYLLPFISRGEITLISECTNEERANIELKSPNYLSFFQIVQLEEPKPETATLMIRKKVSDLAQTYKVQLEDEAVLEVIRLNKRFTPYAGI